MICKNRNTENASGAPFCKKCGSKIDENTKVCPKCDGILLNTTEEDNPKGTRKVASKRKHLIVVVFLLLTISVIAFFLKSFVFTPAKGQKQLTLSSKDNTSITRVKVDYTLKGIGGKVMIEKLSKKNEGINGTAGIQSVPIDISVKHREVESAEIIFSYNPEITSSEKAQKLAVAYYNEELGRMEILENSKVNTELHTVSVKTSHFSRYVVVDSEEWYEAWAQSQLTIRDESQAKNYFDVVFALDHSGSMRGNDKNGLSKECTYDFLQELYEGDYFTVLQFNDNVECVLEKQRIEDIVSWESVLKVIRSISADGGTNIEAALQESLKCAMEGKEDALPFLVLLSDGQSQVSDGVLVQSVDSKIPIITIGFGTDVDEELLMEIAERTRGKYYKADESDIKEIFEQIREEYIGIDLKKDTDEDGIPDKIETTGMRNQYGKIIQTDPQNADTDNDGISDGMEMGEVVVEKTGADTTDSSGVSKCVYFEMVSDPTKYDENKEYNPKADFQFTAEVSEDGSNATVHVKVSNGAKMETTGKNSGNTINDLKDAKIKLAMPDCLKAENAKINLENIKGRQSKGRDIILTHDSSKCIEGKHIVTAELTGDNIKTLSKEVRLKGLYWYERLSEEERNSAGIILVEKVHGYSSKYDAAKVEEVISNKHLTQEEIANYWEKERADMNLRNHLMYLCNNDIYVAHNFRIFMDNKNFLEKGMIDVSKMVFADGVVSTVIGHPEKDRYKQMLLEYINDSVGEVQKQHQSEELLIAYNGVIAGYGKLTEDLLKQQAVLSVECRTAVDTINSNLEYWNRSDITADGITERMKVISKQTDILKKGNINVNITEQVSSDVLASLEAEKNRLSNISQAASTTGLIFSITSDALEMFHNITQITSMANTYKDYEQLLGLIASESQYPALKEAATELLEEWRDQYKLYANECWDFMEKTGVNILGTLSGVNLSMFCNGALKIFGGTGVVAAVGKLLLNKALGIDDLLENAVYVIGASEIADILSEKTTRCSDEFQSAYYKSYEDSYRAAVNFQYYYIQLQQMRLYGEEQYLKMKGMDGAMDIFGNAIKEWNQYDEAHDICNDTVAKVGKMLF